MKDNSSSSSSESKTDKKETDDKGIENEKIGDKKAGDFINCILFSKYKIIKKIAIGNFSHIYQAINSKGDNFCCKIESIKAPQLLLEKESKIMDYLRGNNVPNIKLYGRSGEYNVLIMDLLGKSLDYYIRKIGKFSLKTTVMLAYQMLDILEYIHVRHIIHRDIKPGNFLMGLGKSSLDLFIIDFGFAKKYRSNKTSKLNKLTEGHKLTGTARFASINAMKGLEQSCRDDLESLGYVIYYFLKGSLPWQGIKEKSIDELNRKILDKKIKIKSEELGQNLPIQFCEFLEYAKNLKYDEQPNYSLFKRKIKEIICVDNNESNFDKIYDWIDKQKVEKDKNKEVKETEKVETTCCKM